MQEQLQFITKLAESQNPLFQQLGTELSQLYANKPGGTDDVAKSVESDAVTGTTTNSKPQDGIDALLTQQMPELQEDTDNQLRLSKQKVSTVRDVLRQRLGMI